PPWIADSLKDTSALLTTEELVVVLRMSRRQLYRLFADGRLKTVQHAEGGRNLVARTEVARYLGSLEVR
ncbi:MAG TPA: helix-turn-helix domain-containing protein, partial [Polyangiaceae bacterium]